MFAAWQGSKTLNTFLKITIMENNTQEKEFYKVVKIFRISRRHQVLRRNLSREEAKMVVNSYPDSNRSMVVFFKQNAKKQ